MSETVEVVLSVPAILFLGYLAIRIWSYACFKSYFELKGEYQEEE